MPYYAICDNETINKGLLMSKAGYILASNLVFACIQQFTILYLLMLPKIVLSKLVSPKSFYLLLLHY